jgi:hypothetical protein
LAGFFFICRTGAASLLFAFFGLAVLLLTVLLLAVLLLADLLLAGLPLAALLLADLPLLTLDFVFFAMAGTFKWAFDKTVMAGQTGQKQAATAISRARYRQAD